jgi:predicted PurR-regulated permease PerM
MILFVAAGDHRPFVWKQPAWIKTVPLLGRRLGAGWDRVVEVKGNVRALLEPYTANREQLMIGAARALADSLVQVILSLVVATMFWTNGDGLVLVLHAALRRLGGPIAERALDVAAGAIRGVVMALSIPPRSRRSCSPSASPSPGCRAR